MPLKPPESAPEDKFMQEFMQMKQMLADMKTKPITKEPKARKAASEASQNNKPTRRSPRQ